MMNHPGARAAFVRRALRDRIDRIDRDGNSTHRRHARRFQSAPGTTAPTNRRVSGIVLPRRYFMRTNRNGNTP
ncbi:hypothetical protein CF647_08865 [Burkholderia sp. 117]|nr:hypothetical protein BOC43_32720 [Burkholderia pseudomallei]EEC35186.1 conserved hypothetical protein [Burkholderia pseudomallei 576]PNX04565.1 hypothetical protein CF649_08780 [Burkholderia sp. 136(2017)]PNX16992.1 hypothetical protein CF650_05535 [Burkholderia sp. 129]PNX31166.1 hypothetical protein CF647_08865 [Burkholderia sp. 117]PNX40152.1 hypothetical protein CF648_08775 [Burkholderia sp. 137]